MRDNCVRKELKHGNMMESKLKEGAETAFLRR